MIQMINHGITTGALFACVGVFYERYHTREMAELGGLWNWSPPWAFFIILASLGSAAVPFLNGFTGEFPILVGSYTRSSAAGVLAALGMILGAYYLLWMVQRIVFGPLREPHVHGHSHTAYPPVAGGSGDHDAHGHGATARPIGWHEIAGLTPLMVLIVVIGVWPAPIFKATRPSVMATLATIEDERGLSRNPPKEETAVPVPPVDPANIRPFMGGPGMGGPRTKASTPRGGAPKSQTPKAGAPAGKTEAKGTSS
jgi:NADH-quinone oxidoreductase subunit M